MQRPFDIAGCDLFETRDDAIEFPGNIALMLRAAGITIQVPSNTTAVVCPGNSGGRRHLVEHRRRKTDPFAGQHHRPRLLGGHVGDGAHRRANGAGQIRADSSRCARQAGPLSRCSGDFARPVKHLLTQHRDGMLAGLTSRCRMPSVCAWSASTPCAAIDITGVIGRPSRRSSGSPSGSAITRAALSARQSRDRADVRMVP